MELSNLLKGISPVKIYGTVNREVHAIHDDSRRVDKNSLFIAIKGLHTDAHQFIPSAIQKGASVIVGEIKPKDSWLKNITYIHTADTRRTLGLIASNWYGNPSRKLTIIGITGTKGKTTTATILYHILKSAGIKTGLVSSINAKIGEKQFDTGFHVTSPEPLSLQSFLKRMVDSGCEYAVLEVTSHGLDQYRFAGVKFDYAILTNISHEHLDYHKTLKSYKAAKGKLFKDVPYTILNKSDASFNYFKGLIKKGTEIITYGFDNKPDYLLRVTEGSDESEFRVYTNNKAVYFKSALPGKFNALNCVSAIALARKLGISWDILQKSVRNLPRIPGRLEEIQNTKGFKIYVDFAHTPDSLANVLSFLRNKTKKRLICIFGCAGERDIQKRAMMGEISAKFADISIFTAEDPRSENVEDINNQIVRGAKKAKAKEIKPGDYEIFKNNNVPAGDPKYFLRIPERGEAISLAIQKLAQDGDVVVICGKGHEKSMAYGNVEYPWSDQECVQEALSAKDDLCAVILAGGKGTRLQSEHPKVLNLIGGRPIIAFTVRTLRKLLFGNIIVVVGFKSGEVIEFLGPGVSYAYQPNPLGTGDALAKSLEAIPHNIKEFLVLNGDDSAFYKEDTIREVLKSHKDSKAKITIATLKLDNPFGLGRLIRDRTGKLLKIVEEKEATGNEKKIQEVNIGLYVFNKSWSRDNVNNINKSPGGEYYIVDLVKIALDKNERVNVFELKNAQEWFGVNTKEQLEAADLKMRNNN